MTPEEAKTTVVEAAKLRMPRFTGDESTGRKIQDLESYLLDTAFHRGDLEEARMFMRELQHTFVTEWEKLEGWEGLLPGGKRLKDATQVDVTTAKRNVRPDLWENISDVKHVIKLLSDAIRRLEHDDDVASRAYTFIVGN